MRSLNREHCLPTALLPGLMLLLSCLIGPAVSEDVPPFIPGYDRFGQHGDLPDEVNGDLLLSELQCAACHHPAFPAQAASGAPLLAGVGSRVDADWLRRYLTAPAQVKPGTLMPDVLHGLTAADREEHVAALVAFLGTLTVDYPEIKGTGLLPVPHEFWLKGNTARGQSLYHTIGCVACHAPDESHPAARSGPSALDQLLATLDPEELEELGLGSAARLVSSVPLGSVAEKYSSLSLSHFLLSPEGVRPAGKMPNLKLKPAEAADLAAYLLREQQREAANASAASFNPQSDLIERGRELFVSLRCANCHQLPELPAAAPVVGLGRLNLEQAASCLEAPRAGQPHYPLDAGQRAVLTARLQSLQATSSEAAIAETASPSVANQALFAKLVQLNCVACHERDGLGGVGRTREAYFETVGSVDIGDEGRLPPPLTQAGAKLQSKWLETVLNGKGEIRPHLTIRMPAYLKAHVAEIPRLFALADEASGKSEQEVFGESLSLAAEGRQLLNNGCVQCHPLRSEALPSVVGTDLDGVTQRVRPEWFKRFLLNPIALKNRTRMPTFFPNGISSSPDILEGKVDRQIGALWAYLKENQKHPLPEKILEARAQDFELVPNERPIVLRTFMREAGTHAVAVGFPSGIHLAFDTEQGRLAESWRGRFLDAQGTWFDRFAPPAEPLGSDRIRFPAGVPFAVLATPEARWPVHSELGAQFHFLGYRLNATGVPIFLYRMDRWEIEDEISPHAAGHLLRHIRLRKLSTASDQVSSPTKADAEASAGSLFWRVLTGPELTTDTDKLTISDGRLTVSYATDVAPLVMHLVNVVDNAAETVSANDLKKTTEARLELPVAEHIILKINYHWK